jgi:hypothetical protein
LVSDARGFGWPVFILESLLLPGEEQGNRM